jgi:RNA polymerase sigma factor (sigma-70 family)
MLTDDEAYRIFLEGDKNGYEILYERYKKFCIIKINGYINDSYAVEDIHHDVFLFILVNRKIYKFNNTFKAYLCYLIKLQTANYLRKQKDHANVDDYSNQLFVDPLDDPLFDDIEEEKIKQVIGMLKSEYQEVIYWMIYQNKTYQQTANILDKTVAQVRMLYARAKKKIKSILESGDFNEK